MAAALKVAQSGWCVRAHRRRITAHLVSRPSLRAPPCPPRHPVWAPRSSRDPCDVSTRLSRPPQTSAASRLVGRSPRPPHRGLLLPSSPPPRAAPGRAFMPRRGPGGFHRCTCPRARKWGDAVLERESLAEPLSGARGGWGDVAFPFLVGGLLCVFNSRSPVAPPHPHLQRLKGRPPAVRGMFSGGRVCRPRCQACARSAVPAGGAGVRRVPSREGALRVTRGA